MTKKPKQFKCPYCGNKVYWRYWKGVKLLMGDYEENIFQEHDCYWNKNDTSRGK